MLQRLQKIIAQAGVASRRAAEEMITEGKVIVNGQIVTRLGTKVDIQNDKIRVNGNLIFVDVSKIYLMLNKPRGYITTLKDTKKRPIVTDLIEGVPERVFPVGRLDYDSEGLLLMTNDGDFAYRVQHPKFEITKTYLVKIKGHLAKEEIVLIKNGTKLYDGDFKPLDFAIKKINPTSCWVRLIIHAGRNRIIRRFFEDIGHPVVRLIRVAVGDLNIDNLRQGDFRYLQKKEIEKLLFVSSRI
jgi:pseudouridine synthase